FPRSVYSCACDRPVPHSVPTRRSSDLIVFQGAEVGVPLDQPPRQFTHAQPQRGVVEVVHPWKQRALAPQRVAPAALEVALVEARSEEHTSELQSRENLVCRLLLEEKKT